jgi:hypothetical protein
LCFLNQETIIPNYSSQNNKRTKKKEDSNYGCETIRSSSPTLLFDNTKDQCSIS